MPVKHPPRCASWWEKSSATPRAAATAPRKHFSEDTIIELVGVIALFGFQNHWNDTLATKLEEHPIEFAREHLAPSGWTPGVHGN